jgi:hypothetical protein
MAEGRVGGLSKVGDGIVGLQALVVDLAAWWLQRGKSLTRPRMRGCEGAFTKHRQRPEQGMSRNSLHAFTARIHSLQMRSSSRVQETLVAVPTAPVWLGPSSA